MALFSKKLTGQFTLYSDHKPLTFAFDQKLDKASNRQKRHIAGKDNFLAG